MADDDDSDRSLSDTVSDTQSQIRKGKSDRTKSALSGAGSALRSMGQDESDRSAAISSSIRPVSYRKGGKIRKAKGRKKMRGGRKSRSR